jgi:hypothetical protein
LSALRRAPAGQDNSSAGKEGGANGLNGVRSGLIKNVVNLIKEALPDIVFLENTPLVTTNGSVAYVLKNLTRYDIAWMRMRACDAGYPHKRSRFFAVCVRRQDRSRRLLRACIDRSAQHAFQRQEATVRLEPHSSSNAQRLRGLGNAVVPACSKAAFETLGDILLSRAAWRAIDAGEAALPTWGAQFNGCERYSVKPRRFPMTAIRLSFEPTAYSPPAGYQPQSTLGVCLTEPYATQHWATPRRGAPAPRASRRSARGARPATPPPPGTRT